VTAIGPTPQAGPRPVSRTAAAPGRVRPYRGSAVVGAAQIGLVVDELPHTCTRAIGVVIQRVTRAAPDVCVDELLDRIGLGSRAAGLELLLTAAVDGTDGRADPDEDECCCCCYRTPRIPGRRPPAAQRRVYRVPLRTPSDPSDRPLNKVAARNRTMSLP